MKKIITLALTSILTFGLLAGCGSKPVESIASGETAASETTSEAANEQSGEASDKLEACELVLDLAASLQPVFDEVIIPAYKEAQPDVKLVTNYGSSGKLLTGIEEANGIGHDIFFSAGKAQVKTLTETDNLVAEGSTVELLSNQLCLVKAAGTNTAVTGWDNINEAASMALCPGSVPVGKYSRIAFESLGLIEKIEKPADHTAAEIAKALGGIEIDEADDVEVAAAKVSEGSCEVGTIYYSDFYAHQNDLEIIAQDDGTLTGKIIYPVCQVANPEASDAQKVAAKDFLEFLGSDICLKAFEEYCFIVNK